MIERGEPENRDMLPRWLPLDKAVGTGEFSSAEASVRNDAKASQLKYIERRAELAFKAAETEWVSVGGEIEAQELVAAAVVFNRSDKSAQDAARFLLEAGQISAYMRPIVLSVLGENITTKEKSEGQFAAETFSAIAQHKRRLRINPHDALSAAEMALFYTYLGQLSNARRVLERAVSQAPNNRYILRAMARLSAHEDDPELGLHFLANSARTEVDPWLVSTKLALLRHSGHSPMRWRQSQNMANSDSFHPRSISELSAQLATLSADSGSRKQAIRLLARSAISPTENAVAQLEHVNRKYSLGITVQHSSPDSIESDEAVAHRMLALGQVTRAVESCAAWSHLEPFNSDPAVLGSFVASITESAIPQGIQLLDQALVSNPLDETLLNNRAVLLSLAGRADEAEICLSQCRPDRQDGGATFYATTGLVAMRSGRFDDGVIDYEKAIKTARNDRKPLVALRAFLFFAREVIRFDPGMGEEISKVIDSSFKKLERSNVRIPIDLVLLGEAIDAVAKNSENGGPGTFIGPFIDPVDIEGLG